MNFRYWPMPNIMKTIGSRFVKQFPAFIFLLLLASSLMQCRQDENFNNDPDFRLSFSADTIFFDTVFSTVGSITIPFRVYNTSNDYINISSIRVAGLNNSAFRINVNGMSGTQFSDVEIGPDDSMYVFAEVTVDPGNVNNPFVIEDSVEFVVNGNQQSVRLVAWGQDAYFHYPDHPETEFLPAYSIVSGTWTNDKPHVVYGYAVVDEDCTLVVQPGTQIFMHNDAVLWVYDGGSLKMNGALDNEITVQGDRLDDFYRDLPGMWGKIWLSAGSVDNEIHYAIIKNGRIGVHVDTLGASSNPTLTMSNTIIDNMSTAAFLAQGSYVKAENCVFGSAGYYSVVLNIGGNYDFRHCTIGNYWSEGTRNTPALVLNNYYKDINGNYQIRDLTNAFFGNCIIYGSNEEELLFDKYPTLGVFNFSFDHCLLKTTESITQSGFSSCVRNADPVFTDPAIADFSLGTGSAAIDRGDAVITGTIVTDILGNTRIVGTAPDAGAFEKQ